MNIRAQLERDEGKKHFAYADSEGWITIGIGHWLGTKDPEAIPNAFKGGITDAQIDLLYGADMSNVCTLLDIYEPWWRATDPIRCQAVLQNMSFNLGPQKLAGFHQFLGLMRAGQWFAAATDLSSTAVYHQLPARYERLRTQILTGEWV